MEAGALYVSVSDSNEGTDEEQPIFAAHPPGADEMQLESWDELLSAKALWSNATLEVGFSTTADVSRAMLSVLTDDSITHPDRAPGP